MTVLYVVTDGAKIRKQGGSFTVEDPDGNPLAEVEAIRLEHACILNTVQVTTQALSEMLERGVELAIFSRRGKLLGQLTPPLGGNVALRKAQFEKEDDPAFALRQARAVVRAKMENQRQVLLRHMADEPGDQPAAEAAAAELERMLRAAGSAPDLDRLRGCEGAGARAYWGAFGTLLKVGGVAFPGREQHPAPDPVNAALSLGYMLLGAAIHSLLDGLGFDPHLGFFHEESHGRPSLALDLVEPFRAPVVDRAVLRLFNLRMIAPADFEPDGEGGMRMTPAALRVFFREWEKTLQKMETRLRLREQASALRAVFLGEKDTLEPWTWSARS